MSALKDLKGKRFTRLTVLEYAYTDSHGNAYWRCKCDCGAEVIVRGYCLRHEIQKSCGCLRKEQSTIHGLTHTKTYNLWCRIRNCCLKPEFRKYPNYGGRGITMYPEWVNNFPAFHAYVSKLEHFGEDGYDSLDRINNDGNYEPGNVRWANAKTQSRNLRKNIYADYFGHKMLLQDISAITGIDYGTLRWRFHHGWRDDKLIQPVKRRLPKSELVLVQNDEVYTTSLKIAEVFEKNHFDVLTAIENCLTTLREISTTSRDSDFTVSKIESSFVKGEYEVKGQKRKYPMYYLNRDAFTLVVMGFTGQKAMEWKWKYIQEFNRMEQALNKINRLPSRNT